MKKLLRSNYKKFFIISILLITSNCSSLSTLMHLTGRRCKTEYRHYNDLRKQLDDLTYNNRSENNIKGSEIMTNELEMVALQERVRMAYRRYQDCNKR